MRLALRLAYPLVLGGGVLVACARSENGRTDSDIIDGVVDTNVHDSVVLVAMREGGRLAGTCTGTMVAPNLVLTARHCVSDTDRGSLCRVNGTAVSGAKITRDLPPGDILVYTGTTAIAGVNDPARAAAKGKKVFHENATVLCNRDVAFVLLETSLKTPIAPMRLTSGARDGELLTAVGWGLTEDGFQPRQRMQRPNVPVDAVGPFAFSPGGSIGLGEAEFLVGEAFCSGDSGGPAFSAKGAVVGVVSRGGNGREDEQNRAVACIGPDTIGFYTHLATKPALVKEAFAAAGFSPRDEDDVDAGVLDAATPDAAPPRDAAVPDASPTIPDAAMPDASPPPPPPLQNGAACTADAQCASKACIDKVCRAVCTDPKIQCGANEVCTTKGDRKVCLPKPPNPTNPSDAGSTSPEEEGSEDGTPPVPLPDPGAAPEGETSPGKKPAPKKPNVSNSGCSVNAPVPAGHPDLWLAALGVVGVLARRRRRSR